MKLDRLIRDGLALLLLCGLVLGTGCSGINASRSVSPASFLLPGLMRYSPPPPPPVDQLAPETKFAEDPVS
jgi:hypothetical protein